MNRRLRIVVPAGLVFLAGVVVLLATEPPTPKSRTVLDPDVYLAHVRYLASDELGGRRPSTPGIEQAAEYLAQQFKQTGLEPAGDDGTYFQSFEVRQGKELIDADAELSVEGVDRKWEVRKDWVPLPFTDMANVEGPLAFAGYGVKAEDYNYDDYADFDASGKILLIFRYEPRSDDPNAEFGGKEYSRHSMFRVKARRAEREGALGLLIVDPPLHPDSETELYSFQADATDMTLDLPMVHVSRELAETLVKKAGLGTLEELQTRIEKEHKPASADMHMNAVLHTGVRPRELLTRNVLGLLKGDGSSSDTIIVGSHYDHLGMQLAPGESKPVPHNGADDNASGTAGVIEMARALATEGGLHGDVLFATFSAEEMGLLGSFHFVEHPTIDLDNVRAMINFDMIGRLHLDHFTVYGTNSAALFPDLVKRTAEKVGLTPRLPAGVADMSDHAPFYHYGIPVLFAFTGVHKDYHQATDDWELINPQGAVRILMMFREIIRDIDALPERPEFVPSQVELPMAEQEMKPAVEHEKENRPADANGGTPATQPAPAMHGEVDKPERPTVRLGIFPDVTGGDPSKPGMEVVNVIEGGPAKAAGLEPRDRIIRIGEYTIKDIHGYMDALRNLKAGDTIEVVLIRADKEMTLKIKLEEAKPRHGSE